jgi:site-specific DNA recombinase
MNKSSARRAPVPAVRCAIYTRKSTEEGLEQEFNSLDAQRESGEAYIKSQAHEGWICLPDCYDDGGFTGGNMDRPSLRRLLADIEADKVDCVVVYKVDRLSRSLLDFARMMEAFEKHHVAFVSVTQQFNTVTSMGRLVLNVLLSFAQFEREIISERTRDKIAAARRKGKWSGGHPILGYDVDANKKLLVNADEAVRVRAIFELYLQHESLLAVVQELAGRGWVNKRWTTRKGHERGGQPFTTTSLYRLLTNVAYIGKVRYKQETHAGEHQGIVDPKVWQRVQVLLQRNGRTGGAVVRNRFGALLKGLLHCVPCGCSMTPSHSTKNGTTRYRYYICTNAQKRGWKACPSPSIPAAEIERFVIDQICCIGQDPGLLRLTIAQAQAQVRSQLEELNAERSSLARDLARWNADVRRCAEQTTRGSESPAVARLADLHDRIGTGERRLAEIQDEVVALERDLIDEAEVTRALAAFDPVWEALTSHEQAHLIGLLVERVDYDGRQGIISITFHAAGIQTLADEPGSQPKEKIA